MKNLLLKNFLHNPSLYGRAQTRWRKFFSAVAAEARSSVAFYTDESDEMDGNPLLIAHFPQRNRAVRIVQIDPEEAATHPPLIGWTDTVQLPDQAAPTPELVVFLVLAKSTEPLAQAWIRSWLVDGVSPRALEGKIWEEAVLSSEF